MLLSTKELQTELRIGRDKAYALMHNSAFPSLKIGGRYYVPEDELQQWIRKYTYKQFHI